MRYISLFLVLALFSCDKDDQETPEYSPISHSFFIAGHTYGSPGVDNEGFHPAFKNKFNFIQNDVNVDFGNFILMRSTVGLWNCSLMPTTGSWFLMYTE